MTPTIPLLNDYKSDFFWKRFTQTLLGGLKLKFGYPVPHYVYIWQLFLLLLPWILGGIFTIIVEKVQLKYYIGLMLYGTLITVFTLGLSIYVEIKRYKKQNQVDSTENLANVLSDEDEIQFDSWCGFETLNFIVPRKKFKINIILHSLVAGITAGLGFWYLLPETLELLYNNTLSATVILHISGWITLIVGLYSVIIGPPPELATYRTSDSYEIAHLSRPLHMLMFFIVDILSRHVGELQLVNEILHCLFIFLPLLWILGFLPPADALILWIIEQLSVIVLGGSPMASNSRLLVSFLMGTTGFIIVYFIPYGFYTIILMTGIGYILSLDLISPIIQLLDRPSMHSQHKNYYHWQIKIKDIMIHIFLLPISLGISTCSSYVSMDSNDNNDFNLISNICGFTFFALILLEHISANLQQVYICFGLIRNKLYPTSARRTTAFKRRKFKLLFVAAFRKSLLYFVSPLVMVSYASLILKFNSIEFNYISVPQFLHIITTFRLYRWIWQNTKNSLLIMAVNFITIHFLPTDNAWKKFGLGVQLCILSYISQYLCKMLNQLYTWFLLLVTSWSDKKHRHKSAAAVIFLNIILCPLVLSIILLASCLAAPILPLFTLPILLLGFPRPLKSWPEAVGASANLGPDTMYYRQLTPELAHMLSQGFASGRLGFPFPGNHYIVRFDDRTAWIQILETGFMYTTISIKGLELQETSCHTIEAAHIDDMFESAFELDGKTPCCSFIQHPLCVLHPYDATHIRTYSDAKNVLTGVIDSPDSLKNVSNSFIQTLIWVMLHYVSSSKRAKKEQINEDVRTLDGRITAWDKGNPPLETVNITPESLDSEKELTPDLSASWDSNTISKSRVGSGKSTARGGSISQKSFGSFWSDTESLIFDTSNKSGMINLRSNVDKTRPRSVSESSIFGFPKTAETSVNKNQNEHKVQFKDIDFGLSFDAVKKPSDLQMRSDRSQPRIDSASKKRNMSGGVDLEELAKRIKTPYLSCISPSPQWFDLPIPQESLEMLSSQFPVDWYYHVVTLLKLTDNQERTKAIIQDILKEEALLKIYNQLVMGCFAIVNDIVQSPDGQPSDLGPHHVYRCYKGEFPWSPELSFIEKKSTLKAIVLKAYRYAVKLAIDQVLLGEVNSFDELQEYLEEYDRDWYIGLESDREWEIAIQNENTALFSMGHDQSDGTFSSRQLTLSEQLVYIGSINGEAVRAQWANLALELLYMTNDDEERYSIQAQPNILRNLTVQAADPPLGYPIYASPPISMPIMWLGT